jgi:hypothetical protein
MTDNHQAAKTNTIEYEELMKIDKGPEGKRRYHEDITVIVVFLNQKNWWRRDVQKYGDIGRFQLKNLVYFFIICKNLQYFFIVYTMVM